MVPAVNGNDGAPFRVHVLHHFSGQNVLNMIHNMFWCFLAASEVLIMNRELSRMPLRSANSQLKLSQRGSGADGKIWEVYKQL